MSIDGIWTGEVYGPFGWENRGVFLFEKGRVLGGDNRQYTKGTYEFAGGDFTAELTVHYYGPPRTVYGEAKEQFATRVTGKLVGELIDGMIGRPDKPEYDLQFRLTKRMELPVG
ncbi:MAG: hypothetical protein ACR2PM_06725 [Hyphomicrobiales bacterium]